MSVASRSLCAYAPIGTRDLRNALIPTACYHHDALLLPLEVVVVAIELGLQEFVIAKTGQHADFGRQCSYNAFINIVDSNRIASSSGSTPQTVA